MRASLTFLAVATTWLFATSALADVAPPDISDCRKRAAGDSCQTDDGKTGACEKDTCYRNDYSDGPPPRSVAYECLRCKAGAKPRSAPKKDGRSSMSPLRLPIALASGVVLLVGGVFFAFRRKEDETP